jgi:hypothetical protein
MLHPSPFLFYPFPTVPPSPRGLSANDAFTFAPNMTAAISARTGCLASPANGFGSESKGSEIDFCQVARASRDPAP